MVQQNKSYVSKTLTFSKDDSACSKHLSKCSRNTYFIFGYSCMYTNQHYTLIKILKGNTDHFLNLSHTQCGFP